MNATAFGSRFLWALIALTTLGLSVGQAQIGKFPGQPGFPTQPGGIGGLPQNPPANDPFAGLKTWRCPKCNSLLGVGATPPTFDQCPDCKTRLVGVRLRQSAFGADPSSNIPNLPNRNTGGPSFNSASAADVLGWMRVGGWVVLGGGTAFFAFFMGGMAFLVVQLCRRGVGD